MDTSKNPYGSLPIIPPIKVQRNLATTRLLMVGYGERERVVGWGEREGVAREW